MPTIKFNFETNTDADDPSDFLLKLEGSIYETVDDENNDFEEVRVGSIALYLVQRDRAWDASENLFEVMDSDSIETCECYESIFDLKSGDWKKSIEALYDPDFVTHPNLLFIKELNLNPEWQGKGIGTQVVQHIVSIFGSSCGLICSKPFPLQFAGWRGSSGEEIRETDGQRKERQRAFRRVKKFWKSLGFREFSKSEFLIFSPELDRLSNIVDPSEDSACDDLTGDKSLDRAN